MKIRMVTPAPPGSLKGNRITALRWAQILRGLGHRVTLTQQYHRGEANLLVALHALRSFNSIRRFRELHPGVPMAVVLTGTDVYQDLGRSADAMQSLEWARFIITLQPLAAQALPKNLQPRVRVIYQSAEAPGPEAPRVEDAFEVCVIGHLRPVKDPFLTARAARRLPRTSRVRVLHLGGAMTEEMEAAAVEEMRTNPRYRWLGEKPRRECLGILARSRLMVLSSVMEGGANVISEALAAGTPVLSSRIAGSVGLLGEEYPGYFPVGDEEALAVLLEQAETDSAFLARLQEQCRQLGPLVDPNREREAWRLVLAECGAHGAPR